MMVGPQTIHTERRGDLIMGKQYPAMTERDLEFATRQPLFFIASASGEEVNLAPKGENCLLFLDEKTILLLDYPGSSNRTGRDIDSGGKVTIMFCSFEDESRVLRLFCSGEKIGRDHPRFEETVRLFADGDPVIVRQVFKLHIDSVENSCGLSVPVMRLERIREGGVRHWAEKKARNGKNDEK
jgi:hypothetical protein